MLGSRDVLEAPKSATGFRQVALSPTALIAPRGYRERQEADAAALGITLTPETPVFCKPDGSPVLPDTQSHAFAKIARRAGLERVRLHDSRILMPALCWPRACAPKSSKEGSATLAYR